MHCGRPTRKWTERRTNNRECRKPGGETLVKYTMESAATPDDGKIRGRKDLMTSSISFVRKSTFVQSNKVGLNPGCSLALAIYKINESSSAPEFPDYSSDRMHYKMSVSHSREVLSRCNNSSTPVCTK